MNAFIDPEKEYMYQLINRYYDSPTLLKIRNDQDFSMYGIQLPCFLLNEKRFLILLCPLDAFSKNSRRPMKDLRWISLQARSLNDEKMTELPMHHYQIKRENQYAVPLSIYHRSVKVSTYRLKSYPLEVSLLHLRSNEFEYPSEGTLVSALETYQTILQWVPKTD
jgi:hypothetical protein